MSESTDFDKHPGLLSLSSILFIVFVIGRFWVSYSKQQEAEKQNTAQALINNAREMHFLHAQRLFEKAFGLDSTATLYLNHTDSTAAFLRAQAPRSRRQLQQAIGIMHQIMASEHDTSSYLHERARLVATYYQTRLRLIDLYETRPRQQPPSTLIETISHESRTLMVTTQKLARLDSVETILAKSSQLSQSFMPH